MAYTEPDAAALKIRYPAFAAVDSATIEYWLDDARLTVTDAWDEVDRARAEMSLAAHNMTKAKVAGIAPDAVGSVAAKGVTSFKSASMSVSFSDSAAARASSTGYDSTSYGAEFAVYLRRNVGGPRLVGCAYVC